jgi:hypothetical protein
LENIEILKHELKDLEKIHQYCKTGSKSFRKKNLSPCDLQKILKM